MAFTTIQGSGSAATTIVGTSGVDVLPLLNEGISDAGQGNGAYVGGQQNADTITFQNADLVNAKLTIKGGQGVDTITSAAGNTLSSSLINGNKDGDNITLVNSSSATTRGGQGADTITLTTAGSTITNSIVNSDR